MIDRNVFIKILNNILSVLQSDKIIFIINANLHKKFNFSKNVMP